MTAMFYRCADGLTHVRLDAIIAIVPDPQYDTDGNALTTVEWFSLHIGGGPRIHVNADDKNSIVALLEQHRGII